MFISYIPQTHENLIVSAQISNDIQIPEVVTIECKDSNLFYVVLTALAEGKKVIFSNQIADLTIQDLQITEHQYFGKQNYILALYREAIKYFALIPQYTYFRFSYLNNIFISKGIYITQENAELEYTKVLETKDEDLIEKFKEHLSVLNELAQYERIYQCWLNAKESMMLAEDNSELEVILQEAIEFFKSSRKQFAGLDERGWYSTVSGRFETASEAESETESED